jgi:hypothetical protein
MKLAIKFVVFSVLASVSQIAIAEITAPSLWQNENSHDGFEISTNELFTASSSALIVLAEQPSTSQPLKPGVYQAEPYTSIVIVPEPTHDDCCIPGNTNADPKMIISKSDLQLVPVPQK